MLEGNDLSQEDALNRLVAASSSIRLHPAAEAYYERNEYLPAPERVDWLQAAWTLLGSLLAAASLGSILVGFRRHQVADAVERKVIATELGPDNADSVTELCKMRADVQDALGVTWWKGGALTTAKWRSIDELIEKRIAMARHLLTRALVKRIRSIEGKTKQEGRAALRTEYPSIREAILEFFEAGELDGEQYEFLLRMMPKEVARAVQS